MISKEFLIELLLFARKTDEEVNKWKNVGVDILNSNLFELSAKLENRVLSEIFEDEFVDIWFNYVYPVSNPTFSKNNPFIYKQVEDSGEKIPVVWDDKTFIDYMYDNLKN